MTSYLTIDKEYQSLYEINRSKFICYMSPSQDMDNASAYLSTIKKKHNDATHNCFAYVGTPESNEFKFSDDGEPNGTAGQPMLNVLTKNKLYEIAVVVTRYFGGIKLGAGGLVSAYTTAVVECLKCAKIVEKKPSKIVSINLSYAEYQMLNNIVSVYNIQVLDTQYTDTVSVTLACPSQHIEQFISALNQLTLGQSHYKIIADKHIIYER